MHIPDWRLLANLASDVVGTPCYLFSEVSVRAALARLRALESSVPLRHWLSLKTQPVRELVQMANGLDMGIDVVSGYELAGAISAGVPANRILVNGVGKHSWLAHHCIQGLSVHFDSLAEVRRLAVLAKSLNWRVGLRCAIATSSNREVGKNSLGWDQFGMIREELRSAFALLTHAGVAVNGLHFHLHTNVRQVSDYHRALTHVESVARSVGIEPEYIDIGGGLPIAGEASLDGVSPASTFGLAEFREWLASIPSHFPSIGEVWLENGRFLTGPAGALVVTVLDRKERGGGVYLLCDGGLVNHARMASIERHEIVLAPARRGPRRKTVVCGPTCGSVDRLGCWMLPESVQPGDRVIWLGAGAYHIPLETRFSTGLAPVAWFNERNEFNVIRERETPAQWWGQWISHDRSLRVAEATCK